MEIEARVGPVTAQAMIVSNTTVEEINFLQTNEGGRTRKPLQTVKTWVTMIQGLIGQSPRGEKEIHATTVRNVITELGTALM